LDPTKELSRLIAEQKFEEAFIGALHRRDVSIVSWLCSQVFSALHRPPILSLSFRGHVLLLEVLLVSKAICHWKDAFRRSLRTRLSFS
jgi:hypothetical protein